MKPSDSLDPFRSDFPPPFLKNLQKGLMLSRFFGRYLAGGDYMVIKDGVVADLTQGTYGRNHNGPNRVVINFLYENVGRHEVDVDLCNFYGRNVIFNPNAWLRNIQIDNRKMLFRGD